MTAEQAKYGHGPTVGSQSGYGTQSGYGSQSGYGTQSEKKQRESYRAEENMRREGSPALYVYGDRICRKEAKQRQLYKEYGTAAGIPNGGGEGARGSRYKIVLENIINLFETIEERWKQDVETAKHSAVAKKRFIEHRRGILIALFMISFLTAFVMLGYHLFFGINSIYAENTVNYTEASVIAASGVDMGDKLFSFSAEDAAERITFACPYIRSVEVERTVPNRVSFALESDQAAYCVNVYGEMLVLSEGLRVLGPYDPAVNGILMELCLPEINYSVEGRVLSFVNEKQDRFVREVLSCIASSGVKDRIAFADLRNPYQIELYYEGLYLLKMGGEKDFLYKLKMAEHTLSDPMIKKDTPAEVELGTSGEASVLYDHTLDLTPRSQKQG